MNCKAILFSFIQYLSAANIDTFFRPFVHCVLLLPMATPEQKTFTTNVAQMQRRRHHMTALCIIILLSSLSYSLLRTLTG